MKGLMYTLAGGTLVFMGTVGFSKLVESMQG